MPSSDFVEVIGQTLCTTVSLASACYNPAISASVGVTLLVVVVAMIAFRAFALRD